MNRTIRAALLAAGSLAAFGSAQADTTIKFWHSFGGAGGEALTQILANFEAANPGIHVEAERIGNYNDIVARLQAAIPANRAPDAVILEVTRYGLFADAGVLTDLTPYLDADPLKDQLYDFAREVGVFDGKNYVVPFNSSTPVFYVNTKLFKDAGFDEIPEMKTWDQIDAVAAQIKEKLGDQGITAIAAPGQFTRWGLIMDNGSDLIDSVSGEILIDAPATIEAYQWMTSLVSNGYASPDGVTDEDAGQDAFNAGKVAMEFDSTGSYGGVRDALGADFKVLPMPCNKVCRVPIGGAGIGIMASADQEVKDAAYKMVSFMASPESNAIWFSATGYMPINKGTTEVPTAAEALAGQPGIDVAINQLTFAKGRPRPPVVTWMRAQENNVWQSIALGQQEAEPALKQFAEETRGEEARTQ